MTDGQRQPSRKRRVEAAILAAIFAFIVWTSLRPEQAAGWGGADLLQRHAVAPLPMPTLVLILVVVLAVYGVSRLRS